jgi:hypothetical protein
MPSFGMLRRVALVSTDVSPEHIAFIMRVIGIGELRTLAVTSSQIRVTLLIEAICTFETSVLAESTRRNISEDGIHHQVIKFQQNVEIQQITKLM